MHSIKQIGLWIILACCFAGCAYDEANRYYLSEPLPAKSYKNVEILHEAPQRSFIIVADFQAMDASERMMQKRAAKVGADAVIITKVGGYYSESEVWASEDTYAGSGPTRVLGTAIKYN